MAMEEGFAPLDQRPVAPEWPDRAQAIPVMMADGVGQSITSGGTRSRDDQNW